MGSSSVVALYTALFLLFLFLERLIGISVDPSDQQRRVVLNTGKSKEN